MSVLPNTKTSPRSYDIGLLFCVRALNLVWPHAVRLNADQVVCQWIIDNVAYFHTVADEGPNPRRPCPTDVETQPLREVSTSPSPPRSSQGGSSCLTVLVPHNDNAVDFSVIAPLCGQDAHETLHMDPMNVTMGGSSKTPAPRLSVPPPILPHRDSSGPRYAHDQSIATPPTGDDRHPFDNKGLQIILQLLRLAIDVGKELFQCVLDAFLAVLPRPSTTHAEITIAIFENYPFLIDGSTDVLLQSQNASGSIMKGFLVFMNIAFNCASFDRQCEVLEMCKLWRVWLHAKFVQEFERHRDPSRRREYDSEQRYGGGSGARDRLDSGLRSDGSASLSDIWSLVRSQIDDWVESLNDRSSLVTVDLMHSAMSSKDVYAVANTVHRFYESRLGANGSGKSLLELLLHPTQPPPPPTHPLSFLFGVTPLTAPGNKPTAAEESDGKTSQGSTDIHLAISCGILTFGHFYLAVRSTAAALRCAEMAILNSHQSGVVDGLAFAHLLRSRCHMASGNLGAATEDVSIALQLTATPPVQSAASTFEWWSARHLAFLGAVELLIHFPSAVDPTLRNTLMQTPLLSCGAAEGIEGKHPGDHNAVEVIHTMAQTVRHALWCAELCALEECGGVSYQAVAAVMRSTMLIAASSIGLVSHVPVLTHVSFSASRMLIEEDSMVMPASHMLSTPSTLILEYARQAVVLTVQHISGEFYAHGATSAIAHCHALLDIVQTTEGTTDLLDRSFHFSVAVELAAASILWESGYVSLARTRAVTALEHLVSCCKHDAGAALPHFPPESLLIFAQLSQLVFEIHVFAGAFKAAQDVVDELSRVSSTCGFVRGVLMSKLLRSILYQSQRNRSEQLSLLEEGRAISLDIGLLRFAAMFQLRLIAAHLSAGDKAAALVEQKRVLTNGISCKSFLARFPRTRLYDSLYRFITHARDGVESTTDDIMHFVQRDFAIERKRHLSLLDELTILDTLKRVQQHRQAATGRQSTPSPSSNVVAELDAQLVSAKSKLLARKNVPSMTGLGDSLLSTCVVAEDLANARHQTT